MSRKTKIKVFKIILAILVLTLFIGITTYLFPVMKDLSSIEGQIAFKEKVDNSGMFGLLSLFGLQVAQIFLIIVQGEFITNPNSRNSTFISFSSKSSYLYFSFI